MNNEAFEIFQLSAQGFCCSQIFVILALRKEGKENPDLVRAMNSMCGGVGLSGKSCGILLGGLSVLGLYGGKGKDTEYRNESFTKMVKEFVAWFEEEFKSTDCIDIVGYQVISDETGEESYPVKCGKSLLQSYYKVMEILEQFGFELGDRDDE
ncbi:redox-active protein [Clostridium formicaceticum]|nr:redox-active protein [Clostridium formicaceticum]